MQEIRSTFLSAVLHEARLCGWTTDLSPWALCFGEPRAIGCSDGTRCLGCLTALLGFVVGVF